MEVSLLISYLVQADRSRNPRSHLQVRKFALATASQPKSLQVDTFSGRQGPRPERLSHPSLPVFVFFKGAVIGAQKAAQPLSPGIK